MPRTNRLRRSRSGWWRQCWRVRYRPVLRPSKAAIYVIANGTGSVALAAGHSG